MPSYFIKFKGFNWHYQIIGSGPRALIALHGFDRNSEDFIVFEKTLGKHFTIYAFDLIYHGKSFIDFDVAAKTIDKADFSEIIQKLMTQYGHYKVSLMGYSMGGRLLLCMLEIIPGQIENIFLMAPDGLKKSTWNNGFMQSSLGKNIFKAVMKNPKPAVRLLSFLSKLNLMNPKIVHYLKGQLNDEETRKRIYKTWELFSDFIPDKDRIRKCIYRYNINIQLFYGKYDEIITLSSGKKFASTLRSKNALHELKCGHKLFSMHDEIATIIINSIKQ